MSPLISTRRAGNDMNVQSIIPVFDPAGPYAGSITTLSWVLIAMAAGVFAIVLAALWIALFGSARLKARLGGPVLVWAGGIVFPVVVLTLLLVYGLSLTRNLTAPVPEGAMRVRITGEMWWWRVAYLDRQGRATMTDANELHIPTGQPVLLELESNDVIHSFWVPRLSGKLDMVPGIGEVVDGSDPPHTVECHYRACAPSQTKSRKREPRGNWSDDKDQGDRDDHLRPSEIWP